MARKSRTVVISSAPTWFICRHSEAVRGGLALVWFGVPACLPTRDARTLVLMTERPRRTVSLMPCMPRRIFSIRTFSMSWIYARLR